MLRSSLALALAIVAGAAAMPRAQAQDATQLLRQAADAYAKYSYEGQVQNIDFGSKHADAVLFRIEHRAPDTTRRWYLAPDSLYGDSIVAVGDTSYDVDTHGRRIVMLKDDALDDQVALDDNFGLLLHNYRTVTAPDDNIAGRRTLSVLLVNRYTGATVMRIAVDAETKLVLQRVLYSSSGSVAHQMRFEQIRYEKAAAIPAQIFTLPSGYTHINGPGHGLPSNDLEAVVRTAGFAAVGPRYLPEGFYPIAGDVSEIKGIRTLHLMYSDGLRTISLFENARGAAVDLSQYPIHDARVRSNSAQYVLAGPTTLLTWQQGALHLALVGELSGDEMIRIAGSVGK